MMFLCFFLRLIVVVVVAIMDGTEIDEFSL